MKRLALAILALIALSASASAQPAAFTASNCLVPYSAGAAPVVSAAVEGSKILKASPGCLLSVYVTTGASAGYLMVFNSTTVPADGAVTPINCVPVAAGAAQYLNFAPQPPEFYSAGIVVVFSTTGCFTKTISATAFFHAIYQ